MRLNGPRQAGLFSSAQLVHLQVTWRHRPDFLFYLSSYRVRQLEYMLRPNLFILK